ncbi:MAG: IclR family transcriptional regulator [Burkholderiales bacterium]|nr:IclR family transcriptional regulator [Burkholderiales bacterium]
MRQIQGSRPGRRRTRKVAVVRRSSLEKMIGILDLFEEDHLRWTPEQMMARLRCPRSTLYRYLRVLADAGLVISLPDIGYTLGPRIAELDYAMRSSDPLIINGRPVLQALAQEVPGIGLLCRYYKGHVLCVHQEAGATGIRSGYERGRGMPFARGAASRVILAHLKPPQLKALYVTQSSEFRRTGMGTTIEQVQASLREIRKRGYCITRGEVTRGVIGVAAPVMDSEGSVLGSLSVTVAEAGMSERRLRLLADRVAFSAQVVTNSMRAA